MDSTFTRNNLDLVLKSQPRSTTKPLDHEEIEHFKKLFQKALDVRDSALRQIFIALTNKIVKRVKDSHRVVMREQKRYTDNERESLTTRYIDFTNWLIKECFVHIERDHHFGSYFLSLTTLNIIVDHITFTNPNLNIIEELGREDRYELILSCLDNSYESNKALALDLLLKLPYRKKFMSDENLIRYEEKANQLLNSAKQADSLTCQYMFNFIIELKREKHADMMTKNQIVLRYLEKLTNLLEESVKQTKDNLILAVKDNPLYPKLTCMKGLISHINIHDGILERERWTSVAKRIVKSSIEACDSVSEIVCNLNPETIGHLPMDLQPIDADTLCDVLKVSVDISEDDLGTITSQLLLVSGWKTIKETSLSLGNLCTQFWWPRGGLTGKREKFPGLEDVDCILDSSDVRSIIGFFEHYLKNSRHRGAFEQAYNGFLMVTKRVWFDEEFRMLLIDMVREIMDVLSTSEKDLDNVDLLKAYVTRRSAGLPLLVQAILISEPLLDSKTLRMVMDRLFKVLNSSNAEDYQRIHCLNILKALIKEHELGEKVKCYVGETYAVTLDYIKSDSFPIKNCANMLLKATIDRTFGPNRTKIDIHRKNQMTYGRFFREYRLLHSKMLECLDDGVKSISKLAAVQAVFIILNRLRPHQYLENDYKSNTDLINPFIPSTLRIALESPSMKLRGIAASMIAKFRVYLEAEGQDLEIYDSLKFRRDNNACHGSTLIVLELLRSFHPETLVKNNINGIIHEIVEATFEENTLRMTYGPCLGSVAIDLIEHCMIANLDSKRSVLQILLDCSHEYIVRGPHYETFTFKYMTTQFLAAIGEGFDVHRYLENIKSAIESEPDFSHSIYLQISLLRFLRQHMVGPGSGDMDKFVADLDIDITALHMTPKDRLNLMLDHDPWKKPFAHYCNLSLLTDDSLDYLDKVEQLLFNRLDRLVRGKE